MGHRIVIKNSYLFAGIFLCAVTIFSCEQDNYGGLTKHYSEAVFDSSMKFANNGLKAAAFQLVDAEYSKFPVITTADKYRYYSFKCDFYYTYYSKVKNLDSALAYGDSMLMVIEKNNATKPMAREYAKAYGDKAEILMAKKRYPEAIKAVSISRLIAENNGDSCSLAEYNSTIALAMFRQRRFLDAAIYFKLSINEIADCEENADKYHQTQGWLDNTGLSFTRAGMPDSALVYYKKAADYIERKKALYSVHPDFPKIAKGVVLGQMAQAYQVKGEYNKAKDLYKKSIAINMQKGYDNQFALDMKIHLAGLYLQTKENDTVFQLLNEVRESLYGYNTEYDLDTRLSWLKMMWTYFDVIGDAAQTNIYLNQYLQLGDSLKAINRSLVETNVDDVFSHVQTDYKTTLLEKDNILKKGYLTALVLFILIAVTIALIIRRNWARSQKNALKLATLNNEIKKNGFKLERLLGELEVKNKEKDRIMSVVAHDLRNPLSGINILINHFSAGDAEEKDRYLQLIELACSDSIELVNEILTANYADESVMLDKKLVDINALITSCVDLMQLTAAKKQQQIFATLLKSDVVLNVDPEKIRRVVNNLLNNAIKFSRDGKYIKIAVSEKDDVLEISVEDEGMGIPLKDQPKVFDLFTVARRYGTKGENSFGLGLSICRQVIKAHGGDIWFVSEPNVGTTFYFTLVKQAHALPTGLKPALI